VLVIEDNLDAAETLRIVLEYLGHDIAVAHDGSQGLAVASLWGPDVVIADIGLPELDGWSLARELRRDPHTRHARLIALTGFGSDEDFQCSREAGFDCHLVKPCDPVLLEQFLAPADMAVA
jgi:two-component system CheB/CheR fusion protein